MASFFTFIYFLLSFGSVYLKENIEKIKLLEKTKQLMDKVFLGTYESNKKNKLEEMKTGKGPENLDKKENTDKSTATKTETKKENLDKEKTSSDKEKTSSENEKTSSDKEKTSSNNEAFEWTYKIEIYDKSLKMKIEWKKKEFFFTGDIMEKFKTALMDGLKKIYPKDDKIVDSENKINECEVNSSKCEVVINMPIKTENANDEVIYVVNKN